MIVIRLTDNYPQRSGSASLDLAAMNFPQRVTLVDVAPRDGLQNEQQPISVATRVELINRLSAAGLQAIECGSFVNPQRVPQMAGTEQVFQAIERRGGVRYTALVPNLKGLARARAVQASEVAVFAAASERFSQININCSIEESFERFAPIMAAAREQGLPVRGYISNVLGCPYQGDVAPETVSLLAARLLAMGCYEVSLCDTIGVGTAGAVNRLFDSLTRRVPVERLAVHMHDSYGQALSNILAALQRGVTVIDSAIGGLGGCPFAPGASGNVATEDVVYLLDGLGIQHGLDLAQLIACGEFISAALGRSSQSKVARALRAKHHADQT